MPTPSIKSVTIAGLKTGVNIIGEGQPVLLLHGWGAQIESFYPIAERLAANGFECHTLDLPGFGTADLPPEDWDIRRYMEFVLRYLESANLDKVHLIGHSFGGRISIMLGAEHPERVEKIVLVNSAGVKLPLSSRMRLYYSGRELILSLLKLPLLNRFEPTVREWFFERYASVDLKNARMRGIEGTFRQVIALDLTDYARRIRASVLLIWGDRDFDTPLQVAQILEKTIPDAGLVVFDGAGHYSYLDRPVDFVRIVTTFFRG